MYHKKRRLHFLFNHNETGAKMALEILSQNVVLNGGSTPFNFNNPVTQFLAGIASFQLSFGSSDDHHFEQMSVLLTTGKPSSQQITVGAAVVLDDASGHPIDKNASYVTVSVIAWTGAPTSKVLLSPPYAVADHNQSPGILLPGTPNPVLQATLAGFYLSYGNTDHHVETVTVSVGASSPINNTSSISATAAMHDASGNGAANPTATGSLIATSINDPGFVVVPYQAQVGTGETSIPMGATITNAVSFLTGFQAQYPNAEDHHVRTIGAGPNQTRVDPSNHSHAQTSGVWAWMSDGSNNHQDDKNSYASIVVVGLVG
ncbi:hypothetical protein [Burkholderia sp. BCC1993]|uniref:hypothetical protein n=1 Tax=Burkholderia sp. BCC1993 TaxID=2817444 RepID=UPI002AAFB4C2|nr:hypothetical protein [Burkholderia sp. BCC1993]